MAEIGNMDGFLFCIGQIRLREPRCNVPRTDVNCFAIVMMNSEDQSQPFAEDRDLHADPTFVQQVNRLHLLTVYSRWMVVAVLWCTLGTVSIWYLRHEIELWAEYFTWAAVRYAIAFNRWPSIGLATCIGMTVAVLIWQSRNILFGLPEYDQEKLKDQVLSIRRQGASHPLWNWMTRRS